MGILKCLDMVTIWPYLFTYFHCMYTVYVPFLTELSSIKIKTNMVKKEHYLIRYEKIYKNLIKLSFSCIGQDKNHSPHLY